MARTHIQPGKSMDFVNETAAVIFSGTPVLVGVVLGVAAGDIAPGARGVLLCDEVHALPKADATAIAQGAQLYWDADGNPAGGEAGSGCLTTAVADAPVGVAWAAAEAADATVAIKLNA